MSFQSSTRYILLFLIGIMFQANAQIQNAENLSPFIQKLKENKEVTQILFLGDSHIQADWLTGYLRNKFQNQYGNAGRGLVFPYAVANSNGPLDVDSYSNNTWENFRLVYEQNVFQQMGASGFVIGNNKPSLLEIDLSIGNSFDKVIIFNDESMVGEPFEILDTDKNLKDYVYRKKNIISKVVQKGETFPELASKNYTTTTRLHQLNSFSHKYNVGATYKAEETNILYDTNFETGLKTVLTGTYSPFSTEIKLPKKTNKFLLKTNAKNGNIFYGFQFLNDNKNGVVFNTVGVNGATYMDFLRYPLQLEQLKIIPADVVMIALGTNESLGSIKEEAFKANAKKLVQEFRKGNPNLPILLISPTDNKNRSEKASNVAKWVEEIAQEENTAFFDLHSAMGGKGYFRKALSRGEANGDGVHFLKGGYEKQAQKIYQSIESLVK